MTGFIEGALGGQPDEPKRTMSKSKVMTGDEIPELAEALNTLLFYAMNSPIGGHGAREVGERCTVLMPSIEVRVIDTRTGKSKDEVIGDYQITIERTK